MRPQRLIGRLQFRLWLDAMGASLDSSQTLNPAGRSLESIRCASSRSAQSAICSLIYGEDDTIHLAELRPPNCKH